MQVGFLAGLGPEMVIAMAMDSITHGNNHTAVCDLKSAYDMVNRHKLMQRCRSMLPADLCEMICLKLSTMTIETLGDSSPTTAKSLLGVIQGSPLNPILPEYLHWLLGRKTGCSYTTNFFKTPRASLRRHLPNAYESYTTQRALNICTQRAKDFDMIWFAKKCFVIHPDDQKRTIYSVLMHAKPIQRTQANRYLGVDLTPTGTGTKYSLERVTPSLRGLRGHVQAKHINSEMPQDALRMGYKTF